LRRYNKFIFPDETQDDDDDDDDDDDAMRSTNTSARVTKAGVSLRPPHSIDFEHPPPPPCGQPKTLRP
jgi:hypothetical protein